MSSFLIYNCYSILFFFRLINSFAIKVVLQDEEGYRLINGSHITRMEGDLAAIQPNGTAGGRGPKVDVAQVK